MVERITRGLKALFEEGFARFREASVNAFVLWLAGGSLLVVRKREVKRATLEVKIALLLRSGWLSGRRASTRQAKHRERKGWKNRKKSSIHGHDRLIRGITR